MHCVVGTVLCVSADLQFSISSLIFSLVVLSTIESRVLRSPRIIADLFFH
jgi:hypothetical protein